MTESNTSQSNTSAKTAKAYSCIRCFERKVKCNKESPCSNCAKAGNECVFRVPPAPRRRKKRTQEEILKARLTHYEDILLSKGIDVHKDGIRAEDLPATTPPTLEHSSSIRSPGSESTPASNTDTPERHFVKGRLIVDHGRTRFVENGLWTSMADSLGKPSNVIPDSSDEDDHSDDEDHIGFVIGATPSSVGVSDLHPLPEQIFTIWQIFVDNVNPLSKIVHVPSVQPKIIEASSHLDKLSKSFEALLFAIYSTAVLSLEPDECLAMLGESRSVLLSRYRRGTKKALARAKFLGTSDVMVLVAFVLHLLSMRDVYDANTLWTLTGVANRIAEGMGVHKDGSSLGLNPFDTEMRRRLWWQLIFLDFRVAELSGSGSMGHMASWHVRLPSNINDSDIWPGMTEEPVTQERGTEMIFCLTRYELGNFWKQKLLTKDPNGDFGTLWENFRKQGAIEDKEKGISELERHLEYKYARYCDPSVPVEFMAILVTRAATNGMRLMTHHPRRYAKDEDMPDSERKLCWSLVIKLLEIDNLLHASKQMRRFVWHTDHYFQWQALILALGELTKHPLHEHADRCWQLVHEIYEFHPYFVTDTKRPIHFAVGSLCLKAWKARADTWSRRPFPTALATPGYVLQLERDRMQTKIVPSPQPQPVNSDYFAQNQQQISADVNTFPTPSSDMSDLRITGAEQVNLLKGLQDLNVQQYNELQASAMQQNVLPVPPAMAPQAFPMQQPFFWWDVQNQNNNWTQGFDFNMDHLTETANDAMDWSQWDVLLKNNRPAG